MKIKIKSLIHSSQNRYIGQEREREIERIRERERDRENKREREIDEEWGRERDKKIIERDENPRNLCIWKTSVALLTYELDAQRYGESDLN